MPALAEIVVVLLGPRTCHYDLGTGTFQFNTFNAAAIFHRTGVSAPHSSIYLITPSLSSLATQSERILPRLRSSAGPRFDQSKNTSNQSNRCLEVAEPRRHCQRQFIGHAISRTGLLVTWATHKLRE